MARDSFRKVKLLKLLELLQQNTDEQHSMTTSDILAGLSQMEIPCDRRTLVQDIATLNELDYEIMSTTVGHEKGYYVEDRNFSIPELKILIDAVHASSFITEKKSEELIAKIASLAGSHRAEVLTRSMVCFNTRKHSNEKIFYNVDELEAAILQQKKILFRYFDLNEKGERVYRRDGHRYVVEPVSGFLSTKPKHLIKPIQSILNATVIFLMQLGIAVYCIPIYNEIRELAQKPQEIHMSNLHRGKSK